MFRRFFAVLCVFLGISLAHAGPVANVEYIHNAIRDKWGVELTTAANPRMVANMEYLMTAVDVVNEHLNGYKYSDYANNEIYATRQVADTVATDFAVSELIINADWPFEITTTEISSGDTFEYILGAAGTFYINWGDGTVEKIERDNTEMGLYSHTYKTAGTYKIRFRGSATGYLQSDSADWTVIGFASNHYIAGISGSLGAIFGTLPDGSNPRFVQMFRGCANLTGSIPENLFAGITGTPEAYMFSRTFYGCRSLTGSIPGNLFAGISGVPAGYMFYEMFYSCSRLTGSIPENLFAGITGTPAQFMFDGTFFACSGLTGSIPEKLFVGISGAPASSMFSSTFSGCNGLTGAIPENLFAGISGAPASQMFSRTFYGCSSLTGSIPGNLFAGIAGTPAFTMFGETFRGCSGLTGAIPENLFAGISGTPANNMFSGTFNGCSGLTGYSPKIDGKYLYEVWPDATRSQVDNMYYNCTGLTDYPCIPTAWGGLGKDAAHCMDYPFTATTTKTSAFSFNISAAGTFLVDWGDGTIETIDKTNTTNTKYSHTYDTAGVYNVRLGGRATGYNLSSYVAAISFSGNTSLAGISGSLGQIFSTLENGSNPRFYQTFYNCTSLSGSIPENLFAGITGAPAKYMFGFTFANCSGLTGSIPENLFAGITGTPEAYMFYSTFYACSGLTGSIPEKLFAGISGAPASSMFSITFRGCSGLTGSIPENLFAGISGAPASSMFSSTFNGCSGLTGSIPEKLFAGITGTPEAYMFSSTFNGCSGLTGIGGPLFAGISGAPVISMFSSTFRGCSGLTGSIPENLFAGIAGAPASSMYWGTFSGCSGLTGSIPENLFAGISGAQASKMFELTFYDCSGLTGYSPKIDGKYLYEVWPDVSSADVGSMYYNCTGLTDYADIPAAWK